MDYSKETLTESKEINSVSIRSSLSIGDQNERSPNINVEWTWRTKHFFILSSAGKPIYASHGDEPNLASFTGLVQALFSMYIDQDDSLR